MYSHTHSLTHLTTHPPTHIGYLPPPIRPTQLAQRLLQQQKYERLADESGEVQEIEMEVEEQEAEHVEQATPTTTMVYIIIYASAYDVHLAIYSFV